MGLTIILGACTAKANDVPELTMPQLPDSLRLPEERALYLGRHFWDNMDFSNSALTGNEEFMGQNFANFVSIFPVIPADSLPAVVNGLVTEAAVSEEALENIAHIAEMYLYEPESPVYNEEYFILFLNSLISSTAYPEVMKERMNALLTDASKNRVGQQAADFGFVTREGKETTLSSLPKSRQTLLIFFDPDCDHCHEVMTLIAENKGINDKIASGELNVVAVYSGDEKGQWEKYAATLPSGWIVGYEPGKIYDDEIYVLRTFPSVYILDSENRIVAKNVDLLGSEQG